MSMSCTRGADSAHLLINAVLTHDLELTHKHWKESTSFYKQGLVKSSRSVEGCEGVHAGHPGAPRQVRSMELVG